MLRLGRRSTWRPPPRRRSLERPHLDLPIADLRRLGGELERHIQIGGLPHPDAGEVLLRLHERPVAEHRLLAPVVDDRGRVGVRESARENPVALGDQSFVERADGRLPVRAAGIALVVDHGNQIPHLKIISCDSWRPSWAVAHLYYEHLCPDPTPPPGFLQEPSATPVVSDPTTSGGHAAVGRRARRACHGWGRPVRSARSPTSRASVGCIVRAPGRSVDLDRYALREGSRFDQVKRHVRAGGGEQPRALTDDHRADEQVHLVDEVVLEQPPGQGDRKSTRLNSSHEWSSYAVFCLKKKKKKNRGVSSVNKKKNK